MNRSLILVALAGATISLLFPPGHESTRPASANHPVSIPLTLTITRVTALGDGLEGGTRGDHEDLYAGFSCGDTLNAGTTFQTHQDDNDDRSFPADWVFGCPVNVVNHAAPGTFIYSLTVWDHDDCTSPFCTNTGTFESNDDKGDVGPGPGDSLDLTINLADGKWTGDVSWPTNCAQGEGDIAIRVCFDISIDSNNGDADGDFLLDGWERNGHNADGDNTIDVNLPGMGASPVRKDLFLELDCLVAAGNHTHCPVQGAIQTVVQSFANAPVNNVDGTTGIQLHIDIGGLYNQAAGAPSNCNVPPPPPVGCVPRTANPAGSVTGNFGNFGGGGSQIPEAGNLIVDYDGVGNPQPTNFFSIKGPPGNNFNSQRDLIFRYGLFVHQTNARLPSNDCTSGQSKGIPGVNFMVSLGGTNAGSPGPPPVPPAPCWGVDVPGPGIVGGNSVGTQNQQAGTLMHEFGHTLGLCHGGQNDPPGFQQCSVNNRPNYYSVMNYFINTGPGASPNLVQACNVPAVPGAPPPGIPGGCDYSRFNMPAPGVGLNENSLDECQGIDNNAFGLGAFNWDRDTPADANGNGFQDGAEPPRLEGVTNCQPPNNANVSANINGDFNDADNDGTQDPGEAPILGTLNGWEDWNNGISYGFRTIANFQTSGAPTEDEPNPESIERARAFMAQLVRPHPTVDKTGPPDAIPGDTLNYALNVNNTGSGPALSSVLTDTKPDNTQSVFDLDVLSLLEEATRNVSFSVPCSTSDGTVLTNSASLTANDMLGNAFSDSDSVQTTVHAPVLTVAKTATTSVNAGEAITYTITYENTGSGRATNVTITDKLPAGVYYSKALDLGTGPQPNIVTANADGTTTLSWSAGNLDGNSGVQTIQYTARPTLLFLGGESLSNSARLTFTNANGCTYTPVTASASTTITVVPPSRDPQGLGFWRNHPELETAEILARIQATDVRFDGADGTTPNGALSLAEVQAVLIPGGNMDKVLEEQLIGTYFNLATRRINAGTLIDSRTAGRLGLSNVREAALYAIETLELPVISANRARFSDATRVLDEINTNKSEVY